MPVSPFKNEDITSFFAASVASKVIYKEIAPTAKISSCSRSQPLLGLANLVII
jgi:hypothetical protein